LSHSTNWMPSEATVTGYWRAGEGGRQRRLFQCGRRVRLAAPCVAFPVTLLLLVKPLWEVRELNSGQNSDESLDVEDKLLSGRAFEESVSRAVGLTGTP
jgi:hypothetical protein